VTPDDDHVLGLSADQSQFRAVIHELAQQQLAPLVAGLEQTREADERISDAYRKLGLFSLLIPEESGGEGGGAVEYAILAEELCRVAVALFQYLPTVGASLVVRYCASADEQARLLPLFADSLIGFGSTEPEAGSDISAVRTRAVRDGDDYVVDGMKHYITHGSRLDYLITVVTVDPAQGSRGLRLLFVDMKQAGVSIGRTERTMGLWGSPVSEVFFDGVRVPARDMIGGERAMAGVHAVLNYGRVAAAAQAMGNAAAATEYALAYAVRRKQFGRPIFDFQAISHKVANMSIDVEAARSLTYRAARAVQLDPLSRKAAALAAQAKVFSTDAGMRVTTEAVQVMGGAGYLADHPLERRMRDAKILQIYVGTNEISRDLLARQLRKDVPGE
jgi:alkylation response protein AidB-like acyl-CoA dehydrogenase